MNLGKVIVTGANGFIGWNLIKSIADFSDEIIAIDSFEYVKKNYIRELQEEFGNINLVVGDVSEENTWKKLKGKKIDYIFHFGSPSSIILFNRNPERCYYQTIFSQFFAFKYGRELGASKIIFASSGNVYGGNSSKKPLSEDDQPIAKNLYASSKIACEQIALANKDYIDFVGLRITAGYGPGEERKGEFSSVIYLFLKDILNGIQPKIFGDGSQERDFIFIEDVISGVIKAAIQDYVGIINLGSGRSVTFNEVIDVMSKLLHRDIKPIYIEKPKNYVENIRIDVSRMKKVLKIEPTDLEDGIKKFIEYLNSFENKKSQNKENQ